MNTSKVVLQILSVCVKLLIIVLVVFGLIKGGTFAYDTGYRIFTEEAVDPKPGIDVAVEVEEGVSASSLGKTLEAYGLVEDNYIFSIQMMLFTHNNPVNPGKYTLNTSQTPREMLAIMTTENETEEDTE